MISNELFGTDGIRRRIDSKELLPENVARLGRILGHIVKEHMPNIYHEIKAKPRIVIGRDTRSSGLYLESALISGISSTGIDSQSIGILPTAAVAFHVKRTCSSLGIMISASHNPYFDNGFKIFGPDGLKIDHKLEKLIESHYQGDELLPKINLEPGEHVHEKESAFQYLKKVETTLNGVSSIAGLRIALDCAHGAASEIAPQMLENLGASVYAIGTSPNGTNINRGFGSEFPEALKDVVRTKGADLGIAFDGDADRVIFIDEMGRSIDGDAVLATIAIELKRSGHLFKDTMVTTVMSDLALDRLLYSYGIRVVRTSVGDKHVAREMQRSQYCFGGENSGHIIISGASTTGDGILAALKFLSILKRSGLSASKLVEFYRPSPRLLKNIEIKNKIPLGDLPKTQAAIKRANEHLKDLGRVFLRYSGTENKARLLVEAFDANDCLRIAEQISNQFCLEIDSIEKS